MKVPTRQGHFELGDHPLHKGGILPSARLSWKTYGTLSPAGDNLIIYPTSFAACHSDVEWALGADGILDPTRWFIVIPDQFGNGLSSSPSNTLGYPALVCAQDNVAAQFRLVTEVFGSERVACVYGWSMGAQQAYHWAAQYPGAVDRIVVNCGSARTATHNRVFLAGLMAVLRGTAEYVGGDAFAHEPAIALRTFGRIYAGWALSQDFYRADLHLSAFGAPDVETFLQSNWDTRFTSRHAANLLAHLKTWYRSDISDNPADAGDLAAALRRIRARVLLMPGATDLYFRVADNETELPHLANARVLPIPSIWGHLAGNPQRNPEDASFIRRAVADWLTN